MNYSIDKWNSFQEMLHWKNATRDLTVRFIWDDEDRCEYASLSAAHYELCLFPLCSALTITPN